MEYIVQGYNVADVGESVEVLALGMFSDKADAVEFAAVALDRVTGATWVVSVETFAFVE
jgi:hypothetical protein